MRGEMWVESCGLRVAGYIGVQACRLASWQAGKPFNVRGEMNLGIKGLKILDAGYLMKLRDLGIEGVGNEKKEMGNELRVTSCGLYLLVSLQAGKLTSLSM